MSLNGLDAPQVQQAYHAALTEAGGWLLLKYVSRDEVDLLGSGKGGVGEARAEMAQYQELSPLYGLVVYRRRKVLVKYVPEGTSRLLQARTTVHLRDVQDKFAPYETMLDVVTADGLSDTALAAAFPLHTASPALSSSHLNEITEDHDEDAGADCPNPLTHTTSISSASSRRPGPEKRPPSQRSYRSPSLTSAHFAGDYSPVLKHKSSLSQFLVREEPGHRAANEYPPSEDTTSTKDDTASIASARTDTATSSAPSVRSPTNDSGDYDLEKYLDQFFKPKIKLGPRPVNVADKGKRTTASVPVSSLPAGIHPRPKQAQPSAARPHHLESAAPASAGPPRIPSFHFSPQIPDIPDFLPPRPNSRGSSRSLPASRASKSLMTPEKQRLMKALEIRKKQMRNSTPLAPVPPMPSQQLAQVPEASSPTATNSPQPHQVQELRRETTTHKADSGIDMAEAPSPEETPASVKQEDSLPVTGRSLNQCDNDLQSVTENSKHADDLSIDSSRQPSEPEVKGATFVDSPTLGIAPRPDVLNALPLEDQQTEPQTVNDAQPDEQETVKEAHGPQLEAEAQDSILDDTTDDKILDNQARTISQEQITTPVPDDPTTNNDPEPDKGAPDQQKKRRRGLIEPLHIDIQPERRDSEHKFLSDEEFMDELQTATFEQATPVAMSKSPASPFFPRRPSARSVKSSYSVKTTVSTDSIPSVPPISTALEKSLAAPELVLPSAEPQDATESRTPSVSSALTPDSERGDPLHLKRKSNVSSGISQRIQALAASSSREGSPPAVPGSRKLSADQRSTLSHRKSSLIDTAERHSTAGSERKPIGKLSPWPAAAPSNPSNFKTRNGQPGNRESVSVTARIVRVPRAGESNASPELQASPLLFNHNRTAQADNFPPLAPLITNDQETQAGNDSVMCPGSRDGVTSPRTPSVDNGALSNRKSFDRKSFKGLRPESPRKGMPTHSATMQAALETSPDKTSRTSRFFKRISHIGNNKRKSAPQVPTITTSEPAPPTPTAVAAPAPSAVPAIPAIPAIPAVPAAPPAQTSHTAVTATPTLTPNFTPTPASKTRPESVDVPPPVSIGDLNVQFPDALLWKRRWVEIDSIGNLMFTAARHSNYNKTFNSKFHMKELGAPFIPDMDRQEMPHSVLFDLIEGEGSLQFASEDAMSQRQLLSLLTTYHQAWTNV